MKILNKSGEILGKITRLLAGLCLFIVFLLFLLNVCTRISFFKWNPTWIDETIQFFLVWMIFLGAMELVRTGEHFMVDILTDHLHGTLAGRVLRVISTVIMLLVYVVICYFGILLCQRTGAKATATLPPFIKTGYFYTCMPVSAFFMSLYGLRDVILAFADLFTGGRITIQLDAQKEAQKREDDDEKAIAEAREALKKTQAPE